MGAMYEGLVKMALLNAVSKEEVEEESKKSGGKAPHKISARVGWDQRGRSRSRICFVGSMEERDILRRSARQMVRRLSFTIVINTDI